MPGKGMASENRAVTEMVRQLALEQQRIMEDLTRLKAETHGALSGIATQLAQLAQMIDRSHLEQVAPPAQGQEQPNAQVNALHLKNSDKSRRRGKKKAKVVKLAKEEEITEEVTLPEEIEEFEEWDEPRFSAWISNEEENKFMQYMMEKFKKVNVNTPLIKSLKSMPRCARALMDLFTKTVRYPDNFISPMGENVSAVLKRELPMKCRDPGIFSIPCSVGTIKVEQAMLDLGASINVLPIPLYHKLNIGPLKPTNTVIELADKSSIYPEGIIEDVLIKVGDLIFPVDFYVLNMGNSQEKNQLMILGRPFLMMARAVIDCDKGQMTCSAAGETVTFELYKVNQFTSDNEEGSHEEMDVLTEEDTSSAMTSDDELWQDTQEDEQELEEDTLIKETETISLIRETRDPDRGNSVLETSLYEDLNQVKAQEPWYADLVNFMTTGAMPKGLPFYQRNKLKAESRFYIWDDPYLWRKCSDQVLRRCVPEDEQLSILEHCHERECGGHFGAKRTTRKVLD